jgi:hypothetical protein
MKQTKVRLLNKANWKRTLEGVNEVTCPKLKQALREMLE